MLCLMKASSDLFEVLRVFHHLWIALSVCEIGISVEEHLPLLTKGDEEGLDRLSKAIRRLDFFEFFQAKASNP